VETKPVFTAATAQQMSADRQRRLAELAMNGLSLADAKRMLQDEIDPPTAPAPSPTAPSHTPVGSQRLTVDQQHQVILSTVES
jgi:hypothetical protein